MRGYLKLKTTFNVENIFKHVLYLTTVFQFLLRAYHAQSPLHMLHTYSYMLNNLILKKNLMREQCYYIYFTDDETEAEIFSAAANGLQESKQTFVVSRRAE